MSEECENRWPAEAGPSLAVLATLIVCVPRLRGLFHPPPPLGEFVGRRIGISTFRGVDTAVFGERFLALIALATVCFLLFDRLFRWLDRRMPGTAKGNVDWAIRLADLGTALGALAILVRDAALFWWPPVLLVLALSVRLAGVRWGSRLLRENPLSGSGQPLTWLLPVPWVSSLLIVPGREVAVLPVLVVAYLGLAAAFGLLLARRGSGQLRRVAAATLPMAAVPLAFPLAAELHLAAPARALRFWWTLIVLALAVFGVVLYAGERARSLRRHRAAGTPSLLLRWHAVLGLFGLGVLRFHRPDGGGRLIDYFHQGEWLLPAHQMLTRGSLPFIDIYPIHGASDFVLEWLYGLLHGPSTGAATLDPLIWRESLLPALTLVLCFLLLTWVTSDLHALLLSAALPLLSVLPSYYGFLLLPACLLPWFLRRPRRVVAGLLVASCIVLWLWRIDFGLFATLSLGSTLTILMVTAGRRRRRSMMVALGSALAVFGAVGVLLGLSLLWLRPEAASEVFETSALYFARGGGRSRHRLWTEWSGLVWMQYLVVPLAPLALGLWWGARTLRERVLRTHPVFSALFYLCVVSVLLTYRSFERHSLVEHFDSYLAPWIIALAPAALLGCGLRRPAAQRAFLAVLVCHCGFVFNQRADAAGVQRLGRFKESPSSAVVAGSADFYRFTREPAEQPRRTLKGGVHDELVAFLGTHLDDDQTFYEFCNAPLLYVLADRPAPGGPIPALLNQSGSSAQRRAVRFLESWRSRQGLPIVVFRRPSTFWNHPDGVDTAVSNHLIAEWIYRHYEPGLEIDGYQLWFEHGSALPEWPGARPVSLEELEPRLRLGHLASIWGRYDVAEEVRSTSLRLARKVDLLAGTPRGLRIHDAGVTDGDDIATYLELDLRARARPTEVREHTLLVRLRPFGGVFELALPKGAFEQTLRVRLTMLPAWARGEVRALRLRSSRTVELLEARLVRVES